MLRARVGLRQHDRRRQEGGRRAADENAGPFVDVPMALAHVSVAHFTDLQLGLRGSTQEERGDGAWCRGRLPCTVGTQFYGGRDGPAQPSS
ncbi:hypothetical protein ADL21_09325 [Streptomyces albus subsp. albus]|nr:hypothetical protein ADL21_09325 [Streptomyces albus subsp. albus]